MTKLPEKKSIRTLTWVKRVSVLLAAIFLVVALISAWKWRTQKEVGTSSETVANSGEFVPLEGNGDLQVNGRLLDPQGDPVAGGIVQVALESEEDTWLARARSAENGTFVLNGLERGYYRVLIAGDDLVESEVRFVEMADGDIQLVARKRAQVHVVVEREGVPVEGAHVFVRSEGRIVNLKSGEGGLTVFEESVGGYVQAYAYLDNEVSPLVEKDCEAGVCVLQASLAPGTIVSGTLKLGSKGIQGEIEAVAEEGEELPRTFSSSRDGTFRSPPLPDGNWVFQGTSKGATPSQSVSVIVPKEKAVELQLQSGAVVEIRVVDEEGNPIESAQRFLVGKDKKNRTKAYGSLMTQSSSNTFIPVGELGVMTGRIPPLPPPGAIAVAPISKSPHEQSPSGQIEGIEPGKYRARARHPNYVEGASGSFSIGLGEQKKIDVVLKKGFALSGRVLDENGMGVHSATLVAKHQEDASLHVHAVSDKKGRFILKPLLGKYQVIAQGVGFSSAQLEVVILEDSQQDFSLASMVGDLKGSVVDTDGNPVSGAEVVANTSRARTNSQGEFILKSMGNRAVKATVSHSRYPEQHINLQPGRENRIVLRPGGAIRVDVREAGTGAVFSGAKVTLKRNGKAHNGETNSRGHLDFWGVALGRWQVIVEHDGLAHPATFIEIERTRGASEPEQLVTVSLFRAATVKGVVRSKWGDRVGGATVWSGSVKVRADVFGEYELTGIPPGAQFIHARDGEKKGSIQVNLDPGERTLENDIQLED